MTTQIGFDGATPEWTQGDRFRKARQFAGLTVAELHQRAGISEKTINNYEGDRTSNHRRPTMLAWAMATGVSLEWLETGVGQTAPTPPDDGGSRDTGAALAELAERKRARRPGATGGGATNAGYRELVAC